jgi:hypothetical protein
MGKSFDRGIVIPVLCGVFLSLILREGRGLAEIDNTRQGFTFRIVLTERKCQLAVWLADERGVYVDTVYVTGKVARKGMGNRGGELDDKWGGSRLSVLPVWAHHKGVDYGGGNFYPPRENPLPDAVTSATPKAGEFVRIWKPEKPLKPGKYSYYIEVNKSFDKNEHHDYSWYRGQPSVVWRGTLMVGDQVSRDRAEIMGHGHVAGADGKITPDLSTLTTSLKLIEEVEATYSPPKK